MRGTLYILLPLSLVLALVLVSQGVVQTFSHHQTAALVQPTTRRHGTARGTAGDRRRAGRLAGRHQAAGHQRRRLLQRQLGPSLREPHAAVATSWRCWPSCYPGGAVSTPSGAWWGHAPGLGAAGRDDHLFVAVLALDRVGGAGRQSRLAALGVDQAASDTSPAATWRARRCASASADSALWATATTAASNGSVNSMHDSFTPLGGLAPMWLMQLGEVVFGGVGSGLYGMLAFVIVAVFVAGLMVGRTPEYLGKKIEAFEMKMASLMILIPPIIVLLGTALAVVAARRARRGAQPRPARFQRDPVRLLLGGQQQRQRLRRPGRQHALLQHRPGRWSCWSAATGWPSRRWPSPARWPRRRTSRQAPGRCRPTRRCSSPGWWAWWSSSGRSELPAGPGAGADRRAAADPLTGQEDARLNRHRPLTKTRRRRARRDVPARHPGRLPQARPAVHGAQPGHVRGRGGQRADHGAWSCRRWSARARRRPGSSARSRSGSGSPCSSPTSPRRWPRAAARPRPRPCAAPARQTPRPRSSAPTPRGARAASTYDAGPVDRRCARATSFLVEAGDIIPADGEVVDGHRLGGRERRHRRERPGDPRIGRRPQRRHRRHARAVRLAGRARHAPTPARASWTA